MNLSSPITKITSFILALVIANHQSHGQCPEKTLMSLKAMVQKHQVSRDQAFVLCHLLSRAGMASRGRGLFGGRAKHSGRQSFQIQSPHPAVVRKYKSPPDRNQKNSLRYHPKVQGGGESNVATAPNNENPMATEDQLNMIMDTVHVDGQFEEENQRQFLQTAAEATQENRRTEKYRAEERAFYNLKNNAYQTEGIEPPIFDFALEEGGKIYPKYDGAQYQKETHAADIDDYGSTDLEDYGILISAFKPLKP